MAEYRPGGVLSLLNRKSSVKEVPDDDVAAEETSVQKKLARLLEVKEDASPVIDESSNIEYDVAEDSDAVESTEPVAVAPSKSKAVKLTGASGRDISRKPRVENDDRTIFVGNVSNAADKKALVRFFRKYGKVESVRFRSVMRKDIGLPKKAAVITKDFHDKCRSINAYVVFSSVDSAKAALTSNGEIFDGLHLRVDTIGKDQKHDNKRSIFIGNLPFDATDEEVRTHFQDVGEIDYIRLIKDPKTRIGKGFGYVQFKSRDAVDLALRLHEQPLRGRKLRLQRCIKKEKAKAPAPTATQAARRRLVAKEPGVAAQRSSHKQPDGQRAWKQNKKGQKKLQGHGLKSGKGHGLKSGKGRAWSRGAKGTKDAKKKSKKGPGGGGSRSMGSKGARRSRS